MAQHRTTTSGSRGTKIVKETGLDGSSSDVGGVCVARSSLNPRRPAAPMFIETTQRVDRRPSL